MPMISSSSAITSAFRMCVFLCALECTHLTAAALKTMQRMDDSHDSLARRSESRAFLLRSFARSLVNWRTARLSLCPRLTGRRLPPRWRRLSTILRRRSSRWRRCCRARCRASVLAGDGGRSGRASSARVAGLIGAGGEAPMASRPPLRLLDAEAADPSVVQCARRAGLRGSPGARPKRELWIVPTPRDRSQRASSRASELPRTYSACAS